MRQPLSLFIGLRFTQSKSSNKFLSFISLVSTLGLILGVATLIVIMSVLNGFEEVLSKKILGMVPQGTIYSSQPLKNWEVVAKQIKSNDQNVIGVAPLVQTRGMISLGEEVNPTIINGIDPQSHSEISVIDSNMIDGKLEDLKSGSKNIILGQYIVDENGLKIGDKVAIIISKPSSSVVGMTPTYQTFTLVGIFHISKEVDKWLSYISMDDASTILGINPGASAFQLKLRDIFYAPTSAAMALDSLRSISDVTFSSTNWTQTHGGLYSSIKMQKTMMSLLLFLIIIVAAFNIVSALVMSVTEKTSDIGILKTVGASPAMITRIFIVQGGVIGLIGITLGVVLGLVISLNISVISIWINNTFKLGLFDNYFVEFLPSKIKPIDIFLIILPALLISLVATIYPARKASKIQPARALRAE